MSRQLPDDARRVRGVHIRLTEEEHATLTAMARTNGTCSFVDCIKLPSAGS